MPTAGAEDELASARASHDRTLAAARVLLSHADYSAAFQRGQEVTPATLEAALAEVRNPGA